MVDVRESWQEKLTQEKLFQWHRMLFHQPSVLNPILPRIWRISEEPMQVVSGSHEILEIGVLKQKGKGRSVSYEVNA